MDRRIQRNRRIDDERQMESEWWWCYCWLDSTRGTDKRSERERERKDRRVEINLLLLYSLDKNGRTGRSTIDHQFLLFSLFVCRHIDRWLSSFESHSVLLLFFSFLLFRVSSSFSQCQQTTQLNISHEDPFLLLSIRP